MDGIGKPEALQGQQAPSRLPPKPATHRPGWNLPGDSSAMHEFKSTLVLADAVLSMNGGKGASDADVDSILHLIRLPGFAEGIKHIRDHKCLFEFMDKTGRSRGQGL